MFLDCIVSSNAGSQDHDPLSWISSFSLVDLPFEVSSPQMVLVAHRFGSRICPVEDASHGRRLSDFDFEIHDRLWNGDHWHIATLEMALFR